MFGKTGRLLLELSLHWWFAISRVNKRGHVSKPGPSVGMNKIVKYHKLVTSHKHLLQHSSYSISKHSETGDCWSHWNFKLLMDLEKSSKQGQGCFNKKNACKDRKQRLEITFNTSLNEDKVSAQRRRRQMLRHILKYLPPTLHPPPSS